jgi:hypothetical protein
MRSGALRNTPLSNETLQLLIFMLYYFPTSSLKRQKFLFFFTIYGNYTIAEEVIFKCGESIKIFHKLTIKGSAYASVY